MTAPLLSFDTSRTKEREIVRIDGVDHELLRPGSAKVTQILRIEQLRKQVLDLQHKDDLTDDDVERVSRALDDLARIILPASDDVHARLGDMHRIALLTTWVQLRQRDKPADKPAAARRRKRARR